MIHMRHTARPTLPTVPAPRRYLLALVALAIAGCAPRAPLYQPLGPVPDMARLYYDDGGGIQDSTRLVVRGEALWREIWEQATSPRYSPPPLPVIDFSQEMVLVVGAGRMTPEDRIQVDSVGVRRERTADGSDRDVLAVVVRTTRGCGRFDADAYPLEIVRVRRFEGPVNFIERREQPAECGPDASP